MEKILQFLREDRYIFVNDFYGWDDTDALPAGFSWGESGMEENSLVAENGDKLMFQSTSLRRGNHLKVSLRHKGVEVEKLLLGSLFPNQDVVIGTTGEQLVFFAPVCKTKRELIRFLGVLDEFCETHQMASWETQEESEYLAMWLYSHNPNRVQERDWGI